MRTCEGIHIPVSSRTMCGIFGYIGQQDPFTACIRGLERLEYRGYDSIGIAGISVDKKQLILHKHAGKVAHFKTKIPQGPLPLSLAIGHTRWATHGKVNDLNAHPHLDEQSTLALVHNGILENYLSLKDKLLAQGYSFISETDTEVIAQLIASCYQGDPLVALHQALLQMKGAFALALIHKDHPHQIFAAANESPLSIGLNATKTEFILSSDPNAFDLPSLKILFLQSGEMARIQKGKVEIFDRTLRPIQKQNESFDLESKPPQKEGFAHFMLKEIFEQPATLKKAYLGRFSLDQEEVIFDPALLSPEFFHSIQRVWILGCGTSAHAGTIGSTFLEEFALIPSQCDIASEARFRTLWMSPGTLVLAISQSGETADTLSALREAKKHGCKVIGICNVKNSTLLREVDGSILLKAGPEISVCSTKAFTSQLTVLFLFALHLAKIRGHNLSSITPLYQELTALPDKIEKILAQTPLFESMSMQFSCYNDFFFMGRRYMFPTCLEAALKLKEISYANANGYPAGELKHGPLALLDANFPVIVFAGNLQTREKIFSNLMEVRVRGAPTLAFVPQGWNEFKEASDAIIWLPETHDALAPFLFSVAGQLFAYFIAKQKGCAIDQPRNLAKSVTVE